VRWTINNRSVQVTTAVGAVAVRIDGDPEESPPAQKLPYRRSGLHPIGPLWLHFTNAVTKPSLLRALGQVHLCETTPRSHRDVIMSRTIKFAPNDIGGVVAFLAAEEVRWITGDTSHVDGGSKP
jgi:hypothetical protein